MKKISAAKLVGPAIFAATVLGISYLLFSDVPQTTTTTTSGPGNAYLKTSYGFSLPLFRRGSQASTASGPAGENKVTHQYDTYYLGQTCYYKRLVSTRVVKRAGAPVYALPQSP